MLYVWDGNFWMLLICWLCKCNFLGYLDHDSVMKTDVAFCHIQILWSAKWKSCFQTMKANHYIHQWDETLDFVITFVCIWRGFKSIYLSTSPFLTTSIMYFI